MNTTGKKKVVLAAHLPSSSSIRGIVANETQKNNFSNVGLLHSPPPYLINFFEIHKQWD